MARNPVTVSNPAAGEESAIADRYAALRGGRAGPSQLQFTPRDGARSDRDASDAMAGLHLDGDTP